MADDRHLHPWSRAGSKQRMRAQQTCKDREESDHQDVRRPSFAVRPSPRLVSPCFQDKIRAGCAASCIVSNTFATSLIAKNFGVASSAGVQVPDPLLSKPSTCCPK